LAVAVVLVALLFVVRRVPRDVPWDVAGLALGLAILAAAVVHAFPHAFDGADGFAPGVVLANALNNLPALLVSMPHVHHVAHLWPLLLGVNLGPLLLLTGSLAGLLWQASARRAGVHVSALDYSRVGIRLALPAMTAAFGVHLLIR
jgi:arsenical pump membrane protein